MSSELNSNRALVIDDSPGWKVTATIILSKMGLQVDAVDNYDDAKALIECGEYELILTDIRLQDDNPADSFGLKVLEFAKSRNENTKVVLFTAYPEAITRSQISKEFCPDGLLYKHLNGKPLSLVELRNKVKSVLK